jgi:autophagy-related protein 101
LTLPYVSEDEIEALIEQKTNAMMRQLDSSSTAQSPQSQLKPGRGQLAVHFLEKKRRKGWFVAKADEETIWESWLVDVTMTSARSEPEAVRNRRQMEKQLQTAAMAIVDTANQDKDHIPPITTTDSNPFPYQILINPKSESSSQR